MTEEERRTLTETCAAWLSTSGLEQAEEIDTSRMSAVPAAEADLEAAVWLPEVQCARRRLLEGHTGRERGLRRPFVGHRRPGAVLGWLPAAP
ncbi:MAG: hypothetical protein ACLSAF_08325 [Intestinimonas sp.]